MEEEGVNFESDSSEFEEDSEQAAAQRDETLPEVGAGAPPEKDCDKVEGEEARSNSSTHPEMDDTEAHFDLNFPIARVKKIMKADPDVHLISSDALFYVTKATEQFVALLAGAAHGLTAEAGRRTLQARDVLACVERQDCLAFLDGALDD